jgi:hypothetical protein
VAAGGKAKTVRLIATHSAKLLAVNITDKIAEIRED